jgi:hypothetical protein
MSFERLKEDLNIISKLPDDPVNEGGLTTDSFKAKFDEGSNVIKQYINTVLLAALEADTAGNSIGVDITIDNTRVTTLQRALQSLRDAIDSIVIDTSERVIPDGSVTTAKLGLDSVTTEKITDLNVTTEKLDNGAVTHDKLSGSAVDTDNIVDRAVETEKIEDGAVNADKLASNAVTTAKIKDGDVTADKLASNSVSSVYTGELTVAGWTGSAAPFTQAVNIAGILESDIPVIDLVPSATYADAMQQIEGWGLIYRVVTNDGIITFYAQEKPTVALPFQARCIRK